MFCACTPYAACPTAPIHERDIAAVVVHALCEERHHGMQYLVTGPQALTQSEQLPSIGDVIGRPLRMENISPDEARREVLAVFPLFVLNMLLDSWDGGMGQPCFHDIDRRGGVTGVPGAIRFAIGRSINPRSFERHPRSLVPLLSRAESRYAVK